MLRVHHACDLLLDYTIELLHILVYTGRAKIYLSRWLGVEIDMVRLSSIYNLSTMVCAYTRQYATYVRRQVPTTYILRTVYCNFHASQLFIYVTFEAALECLSAVLVSGVIHVDNNGNTELTDGGSEEAAAMLEKPTRN